MSLRVVLADDHSIVLQGLEAVLSLEEDLNVVATCTDGIEAVEAAVRLEPDVLVMDMQMPRCGGLEAFQRLRNEGVGVPTVILTATMADDVLMACTEAGVEGIVLKESAAARLVDAIHTVARGERSIPPELAAKIIEILAQPRNDRGEAGLTPREREVAIAVAGGKSNKGVAAQLGISESTVKLHLHSAFAKLGVGNRVQLSLVVRELGWL